MSYACGTISYYGFLTKHYLCVLWPIICAFVFLNTLVCTGTSTTGRFRIPPWHKNFLKKSRNMSCVVKNATLPPFLLLSVKKNLMSRCRVDLLLDVLPFSTTSSWMGLLLSWYIVFVGTSMPCTARKCLVHSTCTMVST